MGKYLLKLVKFKITKSNRGVPKHFEKHTVKTKHLNIANSVNTRVAKIIKYQSHGGSKYLLSIKSIKIEKERGEFQHLNVS